MASIRQQQRRAIETLRSRAGKLSLTSPQVRFFLGPKPLHFLGVSQGIGTCSDLHGINVLVLSRFRPGQRSSDMHLIPSCVYAVLLDQATDNDYRRIDPRRAKMLLSVALLEPQELEQGQVRLRLTPYKECYVQTMC